MIFNKKIKASNYNVDTYKKKIYIYGIALTSDEEEKLLMKQNKYWMLKGSCKYIIS